MGLIRDVTGASCKDRKKMLYSFHLNERVWHPYGTAQSMSTRGSETITSDLSKAFSFLDSRLSLGSSIC